jgi:hypothetical protein
MATVFWLLLIVETSAPLHVGNFPDLSSCQTAAEDHKVFGKLQSSLSVHLPASTSQPGAPQPAATRLPTGDPTTFICVQANSGKAGDPAPP